MIEKVNIRNEKNHIWLIDMFNQIRDYDFYFTEDNARIYITDSKSLKRLFKSSENILTVENDRGDYSGIIMMWKSEGGGKTRFYVKMCARDEETANNLLTSLLWNSNDELFVKIRKDSKFIPIFKSKNFRFQGGRGCQLLLKRKPKKEVKNYVSKSFNNRNDG